MLFTIFFQLFKIYKKFKQQCIKENVISSYCSAATN